MIHNERRLNHLLLAVFFKEEVDYIAPLVVLFVFDMLFIGNLLCLFVGFDG